MISISNQNEECGINSRRFPWNTIVYFQWDHLIIKRFSKSLTHIDIWQKYISNLVVDIYTYNSLYACSPAWNTWGLVHEWVNELENIVIECEYYLPGNHHYCHTCSLFGCACCWYGCMSKQFLLYHLKSHLWIINNDFCPGETNCNELNIAISRSWQIYSIHGVAREACILVFFFGFFF